MVSSRGTIAILTGGGDVPGLNPAIRAITLRACHEGYRVLGIRRGWSGLVDMTPDAGTDNSSHVQVLTEDYVDSIGRTGGTFLHTSRTLPSRLPAGKLPPHLKGAYSGDINDVTPTVLNNLDCLGIDFLIPIGGDDTLSYAARLHTEGVKIVAIPKTMDNDVPGTDYCIGFSTCITRTIELIHRLRTTAGSHERMVVIEVFGRYAGFTAMLPTIAGAADRCVIPEHPFDIERLTELLIDDRKHSPDNYAVALVSEGAHMSHETEMTFEGDEKDQYGHRRLGGIGDKVALMLNRLSPRLTRGLPFNVMSQRLGYLVRSGDPDAIDSIVPTVFGNLAMDLILAGTPGRLVSLRDGRYDDVPLDLLASYRKVVDVNRYYNRDRLRPRYETLKGHPLFIMTSVENAATGKGREEGQRPEDF